MPLWPFGRKKRRTSISTSATTATHVSDGPQAQATAPRLNDSHHDSNLSLDRQGSVQHDLTALPALAELEASPHLRPANAYKPVHPYSLNSPSSLRARTPTAADHTAPMAPTDATPRKSTPLRHSSNKRKKDHALREEEVRQMSAPVQIPKRPAASANDLLRRDSKKARRTLTKRTDDTRSSTISLPLQESLRSTMSVFSEQRGWEFGAMSVLSPRPTVRVSGSFAQTPSPAARRFRTTDKLPELARKSSGRKDRRKVADLANDLNSTELRVLMERDQRRKDQKALEQHGRLERKLQRRAEKQRQEDERRAREARLNATPPTAIHPAFRQQTDMPTPGPSTKQGKQALIPQQDDSPSRGGTYLRYPPGEDIPQNPFADSESADPFNPPAADYSPIQTPLDEPVVETARAVRLSVGHMSPPASPVPAQREIQPSPSLPEVSYAQSQRTSSHPASSIESGRRRPSESGSRRMGPGTWASIFRRGISSNRASDEKQDRSSPSEFSFVNTSRESMSRQPIPAHLVQQPSSRQSGVPARTQSKFREDLPELPISPPASRVQSPEFSTIAANVAAARRAKRAADKQGKDTDSPDPMFNARNDSPAIPEDEESAAVSRSYGSVDSEGSWMSGRLNKRTSHASHTRSSLSSSKKPKNEFTASFDRLPVPEDQYFATLTPENGSRRPSGEQTVDVTPTADPFSHDITPLRQATARRRPTVVHNDPRFKSREGLLTEYHAGEVVISSREGSISDDSGEQPHSPVELRKAQSVNYGREIGHVKSLSAGSAKLLDIAPKRSKSVSTLLTNPSPRSSPRIPQE